MLCFLPLTAPARVVEVVGTVDLDNGIRGYMELFGLVDAVARELLE